MVLVHPALQGVWKTDTIHSHLGPGRFCEHSVRDAGRSKHSCDCLQRTSQVPPHRVDEVPLRLGRRSSYVVCSHLCLVKLPLEDKKGTCKVQKMVKLFCFFQSLGHTYLSWWDRCDIQRSTSTALQDRLVHKSQAPWPATTGCPEPPFLTESLPPWWKRRTGRCRGTSRSPRCLAPSSGFPGF